MAGKFNVSTFFDKLAVTSRVDKGRVKVLSKFGAFVRTKARSLIRKRKKTSAAGQPPTSRTGKLKRFIFFSYDTTAESVVIGPELFASARKSKDGEPVSGTVPEVLEYHGPIFIREVQFPDGTWHRATMQNEKKRRLQERYRQVDIKARPFMGPAFRSELEKAPGMWANSVV